MAEDKVVVYCTKLRDIKQRHGAEAVDFFRLHPVCGICGEDRLVCLSIHHTHGKDLTELETLCHNCHSVMHAEISGSVTYKDLLHEAEEKYRKKQEIKERKRKILDLHGEGLSHQRIADMLGLSYSYVQEIVIYYKDGSGGKRRREAKSRRRRELKQDRNNKIFDYWREGLSTNQIAKIVGLTPKGVTKIVCKAKNTSKQKQEKLGE